uniref:Uncharacterized protein n=1 Tax=Romanomermis culicivorax TaxID=13658 RepID=A0A915KC74_ROMCU
MPSLLKLRTKAIIKNEVKYCVVFRDIKQRRNGSAKTFNFKNNCAKQPYVEVAAHERPGAGTILYSFITTKLNLLRSRIDDYPHTKFVMADMYVQEANMFMLLQSVIYQKLRKKNLLIFGSDYDKNLSKFISNRIRRGFWNKPLK